MGKAGSKMFLKKSSLDGVQSQSIPVTSLENPIIISSSSSSSSRMKMKWTHLGLVFFLALSIIMTGCFIWQYHLPKLMPEEDLEMENKTRMCPRFPEPTPLEHPIPYLREALEKVDSLLRNTVNHTSLPALSAIVIYNDTVLWTGNFGKTNVTDPNSAPPNEYTIYRIASVSKIFPTLMLYRLWEDGKVASLDDPLEKYAETFTIKNPLGKSKNSELKHVTDGLIFLDSGEVQIRSSSVTLRRMASQLSGLPRTLRSTSLLWNGSTSEAISLLQDDVLVADPGTKCHYSNLAYSLLPHVLAERVVGLNYQRWISDNILNQLGMEDTGFEFTSDIQSRMAVGVYPSGQPAPLYDLGWYRPTGQMFSTAADLAKLAMTLLGVYRRKILEPDTLKIMLTPLFRCDRTYPANGTGTPWEVYEQLGYAVLRKDGDLDGYSATLSLIPQIKLSFVLLMAGSRPQNQDVVAKAYSYIIPAVERALRDAKRTVVPPPDPAPYVGFYTFVNLTYYEIKAETGGTLVLQQLGTSENVIPEKYRTLKLTYLMDRVFKVMFDNEYPCVINVGSASISLEVQDGQLFNFYVFDKHGLSPGFDVPGLNLYSVIRIPNRPTFAK